MGFIDLFDKPLHHGWSELDPCSHSSSVSFETDCTRQVFLFNLDIFDSLNVQQFMLWRQKTNSNCSILNWNKVRVGIRIRVWFLYPDSVEIMTLRHELPSTNSDFLRYLSPDYPWCNGLSKRSVLNLIMRLLEVLTHAIQSVSQFLNFQSCGGFWGAKSP